MNLPYKNERQVFLNNPMIVSAKKVRLKKEKTSNSGIFY